MVAAAAALALGQRWVAVADLVPLLYVLPCAAMMFVCMKGMSHGQQTDTSQNSTRNDAPTHPTPGTDVIDPAIPANRRYHNHP